MSTAKVMILISVGVDKEPQDSASPSDLATQAFREWTSGNDQNSFHDACLVDSWVQVRP